MLSFSWIIRVPITSPRTAGIPTRLFFFFFLLTVLQKCKQYTVGVFGTTLFFFFNPPPPPPKKRMTTCQNMECGVCRFRGQALAFRLWERAEQCICDCRDLCQPRTVLIQRCQKLLTCHRVSRNTAIATWCYKVFCARWEPPSTERYTFCQPLGFRRNACYVHEHGARQMWQAILVQWYAAFWNKSTSSQACHHISMGIPTFSSFQLTYVL